MSPRPPCPAAAALSDDFVALISARLARGRRVRRTLPGRGRLHIDRPLPFLCVFRLPLPDRCHDESGRVLVRGEASYLIAPGGPEWEERVAALVEGIARTQADTFGAFLLLELWTGPSGSRTFRIVTAARQADEPGEEPTAVAALCQALREMAVPGAASPPAVEAAGSGICAPPGLAPLLTTSQAETLGCLMIGLEVPPLHRDEAGRLLPLALRALHDELARALRKAFFAFARVQTSARPLHYQALGRRAVVRAVWQADRALSEIDQAFPFLLSVTPVNTEEAWETFERDGFRRAPAFHYRLLTIDPDRLKRRLHEIDLDEVEDPTLARLFRDKRRELDRQITLLEDRNTGAFLGGSLALYGGVSDELMEEAGRILSALPPERAGARDDGGWLDAAVFAGRAREEIAFYRERWPALSAEVHLRSDVPGVMVSEGNLLIGQRARIAARRAEALLHHEVGTHILTRVNGEAQPLSLLASGLPGYDELQEGLAVLAEHLAGGLTRARLRLLAARVVAVRCLTRGAGFPDVFHLLCREHGFAPRAAFTVTMRVFRGGGFTKDAVYLRGLLFVLRHLAGGRPIEPLWIGKIGAEHLPLVEELRWREALREPPLAPRFLDDPAAAARLAALRARRHAPLDLVPESSKERTE